VFAAARKAIRAAICTLNIYVMVNVQRAAETVVPRGDCHVDGNNHRGL
jgi:hypothetical protein